MPEKNVIICFFIFGFFAFFTRIFSTFLPNEITMFLIPIFEEFCKFLSICLSNSGITGIFYTTIFATDEFLLYITKYHHIVNIQFVLFRLTCIIFHLFLFSIQYLFYRISLKFNTQALILYGFIMSCLIHLYWNFHFGSVVLRLFI